MLGRHILKLPRRKFRSQGNWFHSWERREQSVCYTQMVGWLKATEALPPILVQVSQVPHTLTIQGHWAQEPQS